MPTWTEHENAIPPLPPTPGNSKSAGHFALAAGNTNPQGIADPPVTRATTKVRGRKSGDFRYVSDAKAIDALFAIDALGQKRVRKHLV